RRFIIGADDRRLWNDPNYPFIAVGRLQWSNGVFCSGAMVGPRHFLTAKHCHVDGVPGVFAPGYDNGARYGQAQLTNVLFTTGQEPYSPCETKGDWAIYAIDQRLGERTGYFGAKLPDPSMLDRPQFYHIGYPGDKDGGSRPYRQTDITIHSKPRTFDCDSTGPIWTDTDVMGGQSGGPLWELDGNSNRWIWGALSVGVQSATEGYSGFASGNGMVDGIVYMRNQFP
ncbi:trypsin-like serine protease, partial [Colletotrichum somersetense]